MGTLLYTTLLFIICGYLVHNCHTKADEKAVAKEHFSCDKSVCKIIYLNKNDVVLPVPKNYLYDVVIDRNNIGFMDIRHSDEPASSRGYERSHKYYIRFFPQGFDSKKNKYMMEYSHPCIAELGPVSSKKYADEILEQLNKSVYTDKIINIEINSR